ncbi:hypothetical protein ABMY12_20815 [Vibrio vulnificus]|uniref:hypothetical protein n=1 Tax=Vibrio vulnificus TaxID=672 RepID=UPI004058CFAD
MKKITNKFLVAVSMAASFSALGTEWNFQSSGFNQDGNVTITQESGEVRNINNLSAFSKAGEPTFVNMQTSSIGAPIVFKPVTRTVSFRGYQENRVPVSSYGHAYYVQHTLPKKCLVRSITGSIRSQRGATYDLLGEMIGFNGGAITKINESNSGAVEVGIVSSSNGKYTEGGVRLTWDLRDFEWNLFEIYRESSGSRVLLYFEQPILIESIDMAKTYISDPWVAYNLTYNCMAEY